jgi:hypothetical protein
MANQSKMAKPMDRVFQKLQLIRRIVEVIARATLSRPIIKVETATPEELRAVFGDDTGVYGTPLPPELGREDQLAILSFCCCDESTYVLVELLEHMLGGKLGFSLLTFTRLLTTISTDDVVSIRWCRIRPRPSRKVWISIEGYERDEVVFDHSHLRIDLVDGTSIVSDFTGEQYGWAFAVVEAEKYYEDYCEEGTEPWEPSVEDRDNHPYSYAARLRSVVFGAVEGFCGGAWGFFDRILAFEEAERRAQEEALLERLRVDVEGFCGRWAELMREAAEAFN